MQEFVCLFILKEVYMQNVSSEAGAKLWYVFAIYLLTTKIKMMGIFYFFFFSVLQAVFCLQKYFGHTFRSPSLLLSHLQFDYMPRLPELEEWRRDVAEMLQLCGCDCTRLIPCLFFPLKYFLTHTQTITCHTSPQFPWLLAK